MKLEKEKRREARELYSEWNTGNVDSIAALTAAIKIVYMLEHNPIRLWGCCLRGIARDG